MNDQEEFTLDLSEKSKSLLGTTKEEQQEQAEKILSYHMEKSLKKFTESLLETENDREV